MRETVQCFLAELNSKKHISQIVQNEGRFTVYFVLENQRFSLCICNGKAELNEDYADFLLEDCIIRGRDEAVRSLLSGKAKLREFIKTGELQIQGPFRSILRAESIFYLAGTQKLTYK